MKAQDVMTTEVVTVSPDTSIAEAASVMLDSRISGLPVVSQDGKLAGILTEGDLMRRAELVTTRRPWWAALGSSAEERSTAYSKAHGLTVGDVMTRDVATVDTGAALDQVAMLFETRGIKRAPVMRGGRMVGIVSRANLLQGLATSKGGASTPADDEIRSNIIATAKEDAGVRSSWCDVTVANGVVHLWGSVASDAERTALNVVAKTAAGVRGIEDHLRILPPSTLEIEPE
jgi:CBS domain-containing protein